MKKKSARLSPRATVRPANGSWYVPRAPVTGRTVLAIEELIEAEYLAAATLAMRRPRPGWLLKRPGWVEAVEATLHWAWHGYGSPPMQIGYQATG